MKSKDFYLRYNIETDSYTEIPCCSDCSKYSTAEPPCDWCIKNSYFKSKKRADERVTTAQKVSE